MHACAGLGGEGGRRAIAGAARPRDVGEVEWWTRRGPEPHVSRLAFLLSRRLSARGACRPVPTCRLPGRATNPTVGGRGPPGIRPCVLLEQEHGRLVHDMIWYSSSAIVVLSVVHWLRFRFLWLTDSQSGSNGMSFFFPSQSVSKNICCLRASPVSRKK